MKRRTILTCILCIIALIMISISACAASRSDFTSDESAPAGNNVERDDDSSGSGDLPSDRRVVRNASLDLVAQDVTAAYDQLLGYARQHGGYETQRNQRSGDQFVSIDAEIRIPPDKLDAFIAYAAEVADIVNTLITTDDITERYYDAQTRLRSMELSLSGYYDYLEQAQSIEESLSVQSQINYLTQEIEVIKGRIALWDSQLRESTVSIRLRQLDDPVQLRKEIDWSALSLDDMAYLMQAGLKTVLNAIIGVLQWLAIILVAASPVWLIALIVIIIVRRKNKRRRSAVPSDDNNQSDQSAPLVTKPADQGNHSGHDAI